MALESEQRTSYTIAMVDEEECFIFLSLPDLGALRCQAGLPACRLWLFWGWTPRYPTAGQMTGITRMNELSYS